MTPTRAYHAALTAGVHEPDAAQFRVLTDLDRMHRALQQAPREPRTGLLARLLGSPPATEPIEGLYLWGGVGRGKTWLMDLFYDALPFAERERLHFHAFMRQVHQDLDQIKRRPDPLRLVAAGLAARTRVLCLDEMQVTDITDAMLMGGLLEALFARGVTLVTTSNVPPDQLYRGGLQRDRFLPTIALIQRHCRVLELAGGRDYRLRRLRQADVYHCPLDRAAEGHLARYFAESTGAAHRSEGPLQINGRELPVLIASEADGVVWLDFDVICQIPRSKLDYLELARGFHTLLLSNLRRLEDDQTNIATRLMTLVDALYDCNVKLLVSAEAEPADLYTGRKLALPFARTVSRLVEMRSEAYLARAHRG